MPRATLKVSIRSEQTVLTLPWIGLAFASGRARSDLCEHAPAALGSAQHVDKLYPDLRVSSAWTEYRSARRSGARFRSNAAFQTKQCCRFVATNPEELLVVWLLSIAGVAVQLRESALEAIQFSLLLQEASEHRKHRGQSLDIHTPSTGMTLSCLLSPPGPTTAS